MPKVSVLIASYNHEKYIAYAIKSVLDQTYQDFEIIIVDDGSTDNSVAVIRSFDDARIKLICFEKNQGACVAANRLIQEASGEYIAVLNSDDAFLTEKLVKQVAFLQKHPNYGAVFSYAKIIDEYGQSFTDESHFYANIFVQENRTRQEWLNHFFYHGNCLCHPSVLIRKECYDKIGGFDERLYQLPDLDCWIRLCLAYEIYILPETLIEFRVRKNEANASGTRLDNAIRNNNEYLIILNNYLKLADKEEFFAVFPEVNNLKKAKGYLVEYCLAMVCLRPKLNRIYFSYAINLLYQAMKNAKKKETLESIYNFTLADLYNIAKNYDIYGVFKVDIMKPELKRLLDGSIMPVESIALNGDAVCVVYNLSEVCLDEQFTFIPVAAWPCRVDFEYDTNIGDNIIKLCAQDSDLCDARIPSYRITYTDSRSSKMILSYKLKFIEWEEIESQYAMIIQEKTETISMNIETIEEKNKTISMNMEAIEERNETIQERDCYINALIAQRDEFQADRDKCLIMLQDIHKSRGYRALMFLYRWRDRGKKLVSADTYTKCNWRSAISNIDIDKLRKLYYYLRTEDFMRVLARIKGYLSSYTEGDKQIVTIVEPVSQESYDKFSLPIADNPCVSIVIPVYNKWEYTYDCLKFILKNTDDISYEVIIADDVSSDLTQNISDYIDNIVVSRNEVNLGFLQNCNKAAKLARGKYIHFLNNDTNVQKGWLSSLVSLMEKDAAIGMCGSKLIYANGKLQEAGGILWNDASAWNYGRLDDPAKCEYNYVKEVDYISGASILIRRDLWETIGGFDELYSPAYYEDTDLAFAVRSHGYKVVYQPLSVVVHFEGISNGTNVSSGTKRFQEINNKKFHDKWRQVLQDEHFANGEHVLLARDRSRNKKVIVVVDHYVPHYDCDAGGRCTFHYLKIFAQLGMRVIFVGDNYFKHEPYTTVLNQLGIEVLYGGWNLSKFTKWLAVNGKYVDYAYLNRPHISAKYIDLFKNKTNAKIFYFGHDLHFLRERRQYEIEKDSKLLASSETWKKKEMALFHKADVVHVVGAYEQSVLKELLPNKPIRNIPLYLYDKALLDNMPVATVDNRNKLIFVGGFNHKPNEDAVLWFVKEVYPSIVASIPNIQFYIVGSKPSEDIQSLANDNIIVTGYVDDEKLEKLYQESRVVIVPLRYGAGIKGKVVEAMYFQVPIVTTAIGAEGLPGIEECVSVTDDALQYAAAVIQLFNDDILWRSSSQKGLEYIKLNFTKDKAKEILALDMK